ncbi:MAG: GIY-YIG nuclease family protein [Chlorobi bacterium]|nr:GIY-YIG nuclease family protein [Chlorobiota bacterium]
MKYYVYILRSLSTDRYYTGCTNNLLRRLKEHNSSRVRSTKSYVPWEIVYTESFESKSNAFKREKEIKSFKSGLKFKKLFYSERWQSG